MNHQEIGQVLIIDDHPLFRDALRSAIVASFSQCKFVEAQSLDEAVGQLEQDNSFDLALLDLNIPGVVGFDGLLRLRKLYPRLPILVVSGLEDNQIIKKALGFGAAGFVPKSVGRESLAVAIMTVMDGLIYTPESYSVDADNANSDPQDELIQRISSLTPQQLRVLQMLREGMLNKQIAHELDVGATTVKAHVSEILRKLNVYSRTQAVIEASKIDYAKVSGANSES